MTLHANESMELFVVCFVGCQVWKIARFSMAGGFFADHHVVPTRQQRGLLCTTHQLNGRGQRRQDEGGGE